MVVNLKYSAVSNRSRNTRIGRSGSGNARRSTGSPCPLSALSFSVCCVQNAATTHTFRGDTHRLAASPA